jgi:MFS superfamily sulfate permease-like transporter
MADLHVIVTDFTTSLYSSVSSASVSKAAEATAMPIDPRLQQEAVIMMVMTMTFVVGVMQFIMGICHLGIIASFMSTPFNTAYQTAAAFHTAVSQIAACLGYSIGAYPGIFTLIYQLKVFKYTDNK